jgi:sortase (surface protein transpeptidase)
LETVLLKDISDLNGNLLTDHLWFNYTKGFKNLGELNEGDVIQFDGRSKSYEKGYRGYRDDIYKPIETDYRFSHPTHVMVISRNQN